MHHIDHTKNIIEIINVSFAYGRGAILDNISLNVHLGDYLGIVGPNGGGKTTLLKIILGLLPNYSGTIKLFGTDIREFRDWSRIGYVPQKATNFDVNFPATVEEIVSMGRYGRIGLFHFPNQKDKEVVESAIEKVGMSGFKQTLIGNLSGGQQQRVFIARALASQPEIIILDEPTVGVDLETQRTFYQLLKELNNNLNLTLILVSHDLDVVASETTEVACINGKLIYHGTPKDFLKGDTIAKIYGEGFKFVVHQH